MSQASLESLKERLRDNLDADQGQYDKFIDVAITKAINFCKALLPKSFGQVLVTKIKLKEGQSWYSIPETNISEIKLAYINNKQIIKLYKLDCYDFLNISQQIGLPRYYTFFNGEIGINPVCAIDGLELSLVYVGYNDEYLLSRCLELVEARALYELQKNIIGDRNAAAQHLQDFNEQLLSHNIAISKYNCSGYITATIF